MASLTIRLIRDAKTGKRNVVISYESDSDALPVEHEEEHRRLVEKLIQGGQLKAGEVGNVVVERSQPNENPGESTSDGASERESVDVKS